MKQWTEQPDGTWRRGPLVVAWDAMHSCWLWGCGRMPLQDGGLFTREEAQQAADAWAADMLEQLKELENPSCSKS